MVGLFVVACVGLAVGDKVGALVGLFAGTRVRLAVSDKVDALMGFFAGALVGGKVVAKLVGLPLGNPALANRSHTMTGSLISLRHTRNLYADTDFVRGRD